MKISEEQRHEKREKIIRVAVETITEKGLKGTTMREIARKAGLGNATIYNYFPNKAAIVYAYYDGRLDLSVKRLKEIADFDEFSLQEQLQAFFETQLEVFLPDREFVEVSFWSFIVSSVRDYQYLKPIRNRFFSLISDLFEAAVDVEEIPDQMFPEMIYNFFWNYNAGLIFYWLKDDSHQFENTSILLDKSVDLAVSFCRAGIFNKTLDIASFLFRNHIVSCLDMLKDPMEIIQKAKRRFMEGEDD